MRSPARFAEIVAQSYTNFPLISHPAIEIICQKAKRTRHYFTFDEDSPVLDDTVG